MDVLRRFSRTRIKGSSLVEFIYTVPVVILLGLGSVQAGLIYHGKTTLNYATFEAAREGAVNHAQFDSIKSELSYRLAPLYGGDGTTAKAAQAIATSKVTSALPLRTSVRILNPTPEAFSDWGQMSFEHGVKAIPNSHLRNRNTERSTVGALSGLNLHDANLLKIEVTHGFEMKIPIVGSIIAEGMAIADQRPAHVHFYAQNQIPITSVVTVRMQNEAWEQDWDAGTTPPVPVDTPIDDPNAPDNNDPDAVVPDNLVDTNPDDLVGTPTEDNPNVTNPVVDPQEDKPVECTTKWEDTRYQGRAEDARWWHKDAWTADLEAAAAIVLDFMEGFLAGMGDQLKELWELLKDPSVLWDLANAFYDDPKGTLTALVEGLGEEVQKVLNCGPKDIGEVVGKNVNPAVAVKLIAKLGKLTGNKKLGNYKKDMEPTIACASFPGGTSIWTPAGVVPIESLRIGDIVNARNDLNFLDEPQLVTATHNRIADGVYRIRTELGSISATGEHPFWLQGKGWTVAKNIEAGDPIVTALGDAVVYQNKYIDQQTTVFNFSVENTHTYFASTAGAWVHNAKFVCVKIGDDAIKAGSIKWKGFSKGQLKEHFEKHRSEFPGNITQREYLALAKKFSKEAGGNNIHTANVGNFIIKHDLDTGAIFVGHAKSKEIRTFYIDDGRSPDPFQAAIDYATELSQNG